MKVDRQQTGMLRLGSSMLLVGLIAALISPCGCTDEDMPQTQPASQAGNAVSVHRHSDGPVTVSAWSDREQVTIAEPLTVTWQVDAPAGVKVHLPPVGSQLGEFEVVGEDTLSDIPVHSGRRWTRRLELEATTGGRLQIPALEIGYLDDRSDRQQRGALQTEPMPIRVVSVLEGQVDPRKFRDVKGAVAPAPPESAGDWVLIASGSAAVLVLAAGVGAAVVLLRRRHRQTAWAWALNALKQLRDDRQLISEQPGACYDQLMAILRRYMQRRFGMSVDAMTSSQFVTQLRNESMFDRELEKQLGVFFEIADMARFACLQPVAQQVHEAIDQVQWFVEQTAQDRETSPAGESCEQEASV